MRRLGLAACAVVLALAGAPPAGAGGPVYSYTDAEGVVHFTNVPQDARYRRVRFRKPGPQRIGRAPKRDDYDQLIGRAAREERLQPALVKAVIAAESNFDPGAVSRAGAQGLMQLMPQTAASLGVSDPFAPEQNVRGGVRYLRRMLDRYGDPIRALAAYNAGPQAVDRFGGMPPYPETRDYVERVLTYYRAYNGDFGR